MAIISILQVVIILFAVFAWSRALLRMKDKHISLGEFSFWSLIWAAVIFFSFFPTLITRASWAVGIGRGVDLAVYTSIILLFYLMFRLYVKIDEQNREMTKLIREVAIRDAKKKK